MSEKLDIDAYLRCDCADRINQKCDRCVVREHIAAQRSALDLSFAALRHVEDWQWGKREPELRDDQVLSAETVRPMISDAVAAIKALRDTTHISDNPASTPDNVSSEG